MSLESEDFFNSMAAADFIKTMIKAVSDIKNPAEDLDKINWEVGLAIFNENNFTRLSLHDIKITVEEIDALWTVEDKDIHNFYALLGKSISNAIEESQTPGDQNSTL